MSDVTPVNNGAVRVSEGVQLYGDCDAANTLSSPEFQWNKQEEDGRILVRTLSPGDKSCDVNSEFGETVDGMVVFSGGGEEPDYVIYKVDYSDTEEKILRFFPNGPNALGRGLGSTCRGRCIDGFVPELQF